MSLKTSSTAPPLIASLVWGPSGLHDAQADALQNLGYRHAFMEHDAPIPPGTDAVLVQGPYGSLAPLLKQIVAQPPAARPLLLYWFGESLELQLPEWVRRPATRAFSDLCYEAGEAGPLGTLVQRYAPPAFKRKGTRFGFVGDLRWMHAHGLPDVLAVTSTVYAEYFRRFGLKPIVIQRGHHANHGRLLNLPRDIHLLSMGQYRTRRRKRAIVWLQGEMERRGLVMHAYDGVTRPFIFGETRTELLNRTWFVLNVNFSDPTNELSIRHFVAGANGAVTMSEPTAGGYPFVNGTHVIECSIEEMPDRIAYYVAHPEEWQALSNNMHRLITQDLTLEHSLAQIMTAAGLCSEYTC